MKLLFVCFIIAACVIPCSDANAFIFPNYTAPIGTFSNNAALREFVGNHTNVLTFQFATGSDILNLDWLKELLNAIPEPKPAVALFRGPKIIRYSNNLPPQTYYGDTDPLMIWEWLVSQREQEYFLKPLK